MGFFDNLSKKATETYKNTADKTNRMAREMKLKSYINENKNRIDRVYTVIGRKVYEKHVEGKIGEIEDYIKPDIEEIEEIARKIENMNTEIRSINHLKLCEKCATEISLDAVFCPKCGAKQTTEVNINVSGEPVAEVNVQVVETPVEEVAVPAEEPAVEEPIIEEATIEEQTAEEAPVAEEVTDQETEPQESENQEN